MLFLAWFISGIVMMYARMPSLSAEERLASPAAARSFGRPLRAGRSRGRRRLHPAIIHLSMFSGRPIYRINGGRAELVYADNGDAFEG